MLKHHWMEEAQHTKVDTLLVAQLAKEISSQEIEAGIADYLAIVKILDAELMTQVQLDLESLSQGTGRTFTDSAQQEIQTIQGQSYRWAFLCAGMTHPNFVKIISELSQTGQARVTEMAKALLLKCSLARLSREVIGNIERVAICSINRAVMYSITTGGWV